MRPGGEGGRHLRGIAIDDPARTPAALPGPAALLIAPARVFSALSLRAPASGAPGSGWPGRGRLRESGPVAGSRFPQTVRDQRIDPVTRQFRMLVRVR